MRHSIAWPVGTDVRLREGQRLAGRDEQLRAHEVESGDGFRDRMLDLQARVHFQKIEPRVVAVALEQELDRAGVDVADRAAGRRAPRRVMRARTAGDRRGAGASSITF